MKRKDGGRARTGRPPLSPGEESVLLPGLRVTLAHYLALLAVIEAGHATTLTQAQRWCIEHAQLPQVQAPTVRASTERAT